MEGTNNILITRFINTEASCYFCGEHGSLFRQYQIGQQNLHVCLACENVRAIQILTDSFKYEQTNH